MNFKTKLPQKDIQDRVKELAATIAVDYKDQEVVLLGILKGAFMFLSDLSKALWQEGVHDKEISFMTIESYGSDTESSKNPHITQDIDIDIAGRHVLIIEDIVDTGHSLKALQELLLSRKPASLKTAVLLSKQSRREVDVSVDYIGFEVEGWVEGYGMDTDQKGRSRPEVIEII